MKSIFLVFMLIAGTLQADCSKKGTLDELVFAKLNALELSDAFKQFSSILNHHQVMKVEFPKKNKIKVITQTIGTGDTQIKDASQYAFCFSYEEKKWYLENKVLLPYNKSVK